jgi:hypothetical protein
MDNSWQNSTFFLLAECMKIFSFLFFDHIHSKFAGSANMTPKISFQHNQHGVSKMQTCLLIPNFLQWYFKKVTEESYSQKLSEFFGFALFAQGFVAITFLLIFFEPISRESGKILFMNFFFLGGTLFVVILVLFTNFQCKGSKIIIFKHFAKILIFFANICRSQFEPHQASSFENRRCLV